MKLHITFARARKNIVKYHKSFYCCIAAERVE